MVKRRKRIVLVDAESNSSISELFHLISLPLGSNVPNLFPDLN